MAHVRTARRSASYLHSRDCTILHQIRLSSVIFEKEAKRILIVDQNDAVALYTVAAGSRFFCPAPRIRKSLRTGRSSPYVEKLTSAYYEFLPKWSNPSADMNPKYIEVITFHIRYGKGDDFRSAVAKVHEANQKLKVPYHYGWYRLFNGGPGGTYVLTEDHANWASFEDDPAVTPMRDRLREAFGEQEAMSVVERLNAAIEGTYSAIVRTRPDLSYVPAK
jgi:hypothetical protein